MTMAVRGGGGVGVGLRGMEGGGLTKVDDACE